VTEIRHAVWNLLGAAAVFAGWWWIARSGMVSQILLPTPDRVARRLLELGGDAAFWKDFGSTLLLWTLSVAVGTGAGLLLGLLSYLNRAVWYFIQTPVEFIRSLPSVVLVPLVALFAGLGGATQFWSAFAVVAALMISSSASVVRRLPIGHERLSHAWRLSRLTTLRIFVLPNLLAELLTALRAAVPLALVVLIACDMLVATESGLGRLIRDGLAILDMSTTLAVVFVVGLLGLGGSLFVSFVDRKLISWRR
jgi:taurine transport system permease protein